MRALPLIFSTLIIFSSMLSGCLDDGSVGEERKLEFIEIEISITNSSGEAWQLLMPIPLTDDQGGVSPVVGYMMANHDEISLYQNESGGNVIMVSGVGDMVISIDEKHYRTGSNSDYNPDILPMEKLQDLQGSRMGGVFNLTGNSNVELTISYDWSATWDSYCTPHEFHLNETTIGVGEHTIGLRHDWIACS